jgi:VWFA-related protein
MFSAKGHRNQKRHARQCIIVCVAWLLYTLRGLAQVRLSAPPEAGEKAAYKIAVDVSLVVLPVSVTDRKGHVVPDLHREDFRVYEDGRLQKIALFKHEDIPVTVGLVVDNSTSMLPKRPEVVEALLAFARSSNPHDELFVVNFNDTASFGLPWNVLFTDQPELLSKCVSLTARGRTALYDAMVLAIDRLKQGTRPKKALIVVSDGGDNASRRRLQEVLRAAEASNAVIYTIGLLDEHETDQNPGVLRRIAKVTGGEAYFPDTLAGAQRIFQDIARDLREQYTIGHTPPNPDQNKAYRRVQVKVVAPGKAKLLVRTRGGYYMPAPGSPSPLALQGDSN